ncbi:ATP-dependent DNA helicase PcrA [Candidatus Kaiserbacteria bacterium CG10_big_fil_rev_8_21_14_0_10_56_12]|uniref:DNA 3'-5' helicase n=1 Tax=Candidatus Kaiserbacteria bacterium CG10_big_fil_rev_8_21_14_0_10_56_12 TaxID=1974611 RepID=A0A2H0U9F3_9BACT|nr:MAG: ATP-dependent DNA helicase PcrA [Candidatus Kaiserbacteria bacterium CG10_big_fil_rev_8_21_14_0_10_56_12]
MNYLDGLNAAQAQAVQSTEGPVSVIAGAGSGKTRVLTTRIYHLIRKGIPANEILAVTFTNKAAREMRERVRAMLGDVALNDTPFIATFHGLGRELLESYGKVIGVPRYFSVYDRDDSEKVVASALKALDVETKELSPRAVLGRISRAKGEGLRASDYHERHGRSSFGNRITSEVWLRYEKTLAAEKALDFDDLIALPVHMLEEHADVRARAQERWRYIHIDEYQDTNNLQEKLAGLLAEKHRNIFVVGDGDQAIYGWRGAKMENILNFEKRNPGAETIVLEHNYRSTRNLVDAANGVIEKNKNRKNKISTTENARGEPIVIHIAVNAEDEAHWIAHKIRDLMRDGTKPEQVAILFRTNFQSRALEEGLLHAGIPYKLLGTHFFARKEIKDVLAWIRLALDPTRQVDMVRAVASPPRGIGKVTLGKLVAGQRESLRSSERSKVETFEKLVAEIGRAVDSLCASEFVKLVIEKSGMRAALAEGNEEERERFENIEELASVATRHDGLPGREGIAAFLADAALSSDQDEMDLPAKAGQKEKGGVTLMTVHAAKGLEFDTVFVSGMEEGLFPHHGMGNDVNRDEEEERRLFYVAMTRAKTRLFLTLARIRKIYGSDFLSEPSSFLADIDNTLLLLDETTGESFGSYSSEDVIEV